MEKNESNNLAKTYCDCLVVLDDDNRFFYSKLRTSFGAVLVYGDHRVYISDGRYEYFLKSHLMGWEIVCTNGAQLFDTIAKECAKRGVARLGFENATILKTQYDGLIKSLSTAIPTGCTLVPCSDKIRDEKSIKNAEMIECTAEAQRIAEETLAKVIPLIKIGITEREIAARIEYEMILLGAETKSFDTIVAFGENSAKPHHAPSYRKFAKGDIVLVDMGCKFGGYCSDMTRTFFLSESDNQELITIHGVVTEAQKYAIKNTRPGMTCGEVDAMCREYIKSNGYEKEFSHGTGHGVGIAVHEYPRVGAGSEDILKEGMIITIEPGIYVQGLGGVRMEDMVVVTHDGVRNFTKFSKNLYSK
ncbi:MAG: aminopeptidase P family protein [Firmicutes bacterium]|nr:aminopeptidase P family protein [Bacillota bacterium]